MGIEIGMAIIYFHSGMKSRNYFENGNRIEIVIVV